MKRRGPVIRFLAVVWATLQLASPAVSAIADGTLASDGAFGRIAHVESTTTSSCPVVHSPDCVVCRYLSGATGENVPAQLMPPRTTNRAGCPGQDIGSRSGLPSLPHGRAPPVI